jgi:hypothetical protein
MDQKGVFSVVYCTYRSIRSVLWRGVVERVDALQALAAEVGQFHAQAHATTWLLLITPPPRVNHVSSASLFECFSYVCREPVLVK